MEYINYPATRCPTNVSCGHSSEGGAATLNCDTFLTLLSLVLPPPLSRYYLLAADKAWHGQCLRCSRCSQPLDTELSCFCRGGNIYCKDCRWANSHKSRRVWFLYYFILFVGVRIVRNLKWGRHNSGKSTGIHSPPSVHQSNRVPFLNLPFLPLPFHSRCDIIKILRGADYWSLTGGRGDGGARLIKIFHLVHITKRPWWAR